MSKNNKKTLNKRTLTNSEIYKNQSNNPDEEFASEFDSQAKKISTNKNKQPQSNYNPS